MNIKNSFIRYRYLIAVLIAVGLVVHFACYSTNYAGNPDYYVSGLVHASSSWEISLGRFGLLLDHFRAGLSSNILNSVIAIVCMALSSVFIIDFFKTENDDIKVADFIIGLFIMVSPSFATVLTYYYCSDIYMIDFLLLVLGAYIIKKYNNTKGILVGVVFIAIGTSIYQAYIGIVALLFLLDIVYSVLFYNDNIKTIGVKLARYICTGMIGILLYYVLNKIVLRVFNVEMSDYSGANNITIINTIKNIPTAFIKTYTVLNDFLFTDELVSNSSWHLKYVLLVVVMFFAVAFLIEIVKKKNILVLLCLCCLPLAVNLISFIATQREINMLMALPMTMFIPILAMPVVKITGKYNKKYILNIVMVLLLVCVYLYAYMDNSYYMARKATFDKTYTMAERMLDRAEEYYLDDSDNQIMIVGSVNDNKYYKQDNMIYKVANDSMSKLGIIWDTYGSSKQSWAGFYSMFFSAKNIDIFTDDEYIDIVTSSEFNEMGIFPESSSVRRINNFIVIRLSENIFMP